MAFYTCSGASPSKVQLLGELFERHRLAHHRDVISLTVPACSIAHGMRSILFSVKTTCICFLPADRRPISTEHTSFVSFGDARISMVVASLDIISVFLPFLLRRHALELLRLRPCHGQAENTGLCFNGLSTLANQRTVDVQSEKPNPHYENTTVDVGDYFGYPSIVFVRVPTQDDAPLF
jgi:hypothetical protein